MELPFEPRTDSPQDPAETPSAEAARLAPSLHLTHIRAEVDAALSYLKGNKSKSVEESDAYKTLMNLGILHDMLSIAEKRRILNGMSHAIGEFMNGRKPNGEYITLVHRILMNGREKKPRAA